MRLFPSLSTVMVFPLDAIGQSRYSQDLLRQGREAWRKAHGGISIESDRVGVFALAYARRLAAEDIGSESDVAARRGMRFIHATDRRAKVYAQPDARGRSHHYKNEYGQGHDAAEGALGVARRAS